MRPEYIAAGVASIVVVLLVVLAARRRRSKGDENSETADDDSPGVIRRIVAGLTSTRAKAFYASVVTFAVAVVILYLSYRTFGLIETIMYAFAFAFTATVAPLTIMIARAGTPFNVGIGRFHVVLGAFAFGHHYLVQLEDKWEWCPGTADKFWLDGTWYTVDAGLSNRSVLGWRPFGILRFKGDEPLQDARVDESAVPDGGVSQGSYQMTADMPDADSGEWVLDLRRVVTRGVKRIGDIDLIETAEEIIERGQVDESKMGSYRPAVTFVVTLIIGLITGYVFLYAA